MSGDYTLQIIWLSETRARLKMVCQKRKDVGRRHLSTLDTQSKYEKQDIGLDD